MTSDSNPLRASLAGRTALVVDDNEAVRTAFDVLLSLHGARVVGAATPAEGLGALQASPVDVVIQDMNFRREATGGEEGIALFHEIRRRFPDIPIILLTAWTHLETAVELVKAGAADYVAKPWDDDRLLTTVRNLLDLRSARAEAQDIRAERHEARDALAAASKGKDPSADRHVQRADMTITELVERYLDEGRASKPAKKAASWASDASNLRRHVVPLIGRRQLSSLTSDDIQKFQRDVTQGKTKANEKTRPRGRAIVRGGPAAATTGIARMAAPRSTGARNAVVRMRRAPKGSAV